MLSIGRANVSLVETRMAEQRTPEIKQQNGVTIVALGPEYENLDEHRLEELRDSILEVACRADPPLLVIDLSHTKFFGSAFIEILFRAWNRVTAREEGRFCLSGLTPYCREVIEVTHLDRLWTVCDTRDEAVRTMLGQ